MDWLFLHYDNIAINGIRSPEKVDMERSPWGCIYIYMYEGYGSRIWEKTVMEKRTWICVKPDSLF